MDLNPQEFYRKRAAFYEQVFIRFLGWERELASFFRTTDTLRSGLKILDAGCGTGVVTRVLHQLALEEKRSDLHFHAFDLSQEMLDIFQQWINSRDAKEIELLQADVLEIDTFPPQWTGYDLVIVSTMLEYVPRHKVSDTLANLKALLKEDGTFLIFLTRENMITRWLAQKLWKTNLYRADEIQALCSMAGLAELKFRDLSPGWSSSIMSIEAKAALNDPA